jgi:hypothetical protein
MHLLLITNFHLECLAFSKQHTVCLQDNTKKLLPADYLGIKEKDSEYVETVGEESKQESSNPETISRLDRLISQADLHKRPRREIIFDNGLNLAQLKGAIYFGKNTTIKTTTPIKFFKDLGKNNKVEPKDTDPQNNGIKVTKTDRPGQTPKTSYEYTINTRCFAFPASIPAATHITGHAIITLAENLTKYQTK